MLTTVDFYRIDDDGRLYISAAIREWAPVSDLGIDTVIDLDAGLDECIPTTPEGCLYIYFPIYDEELPNLTGQRRRSSGPRKPARSSRKSAVPASLTIRLEVVETLH